MVLAEGCLTKDELIDKDAAIAHMRIRVPGLFGLQAPMNTFSSFLGDNPQALFNRPSGIYYNPHLASRIDTRNHALDKINMLLHSDTRGWSFRTRMIASGRYNLQINWDGKVGTDTSHKFNLHWAGFTPNTTVDLDKGLIEFGVDEKEEGRPISIEELGQPIGQKRLDTAQRLFLIKMKDLRINRASNSFTTTLVGYNNRPLLEISLPLQLQVNLQ